MGLIGTVVVCVVVVALYDIVKTKNPDKLFHRALIDKLKSLIKISY
jgi:hypothetical protein